MYNTFVIHIKKKHMYCENGGVDILYNSAWCAIAAYEI
jgi:hypothetical protein